MIDAAFRAARQIFTRPFRTVFWKSLGLTILLLGFIWAIIEKVVVHYVHLYYAWLTTVVHVVAGLGLVVGVVFLIAPVSFIVAGFFFDELADQVEDDIAGPGNRGRPMPFLPALWISLKFAGVSLVVNMIALLLLLVPVVNAAAFFAANAYLLGRGFFELSALRHLPEPEVKQLRRDNGIKIILGGCLLAAVAAGPILNLVIPLFAPALFVRLTHSMLRRRRLAYSPL